MTQSCTAVLCSFGFKTTSKLKALTPNLTFKTFSPHWVSTVWSQLGTDPRSSCQTQPLQIRCLLTNLRRLKTECPWCWQPGLQPGLNTLQTGKKAIQTLAIKLHIEGSIWNAYIPESLKVAVYMSVERVKSVSTSFFWKKKWKENISHVNMTWVSQHIAQSYAVFIFWKYIHNDMVSTRATINF